MAQEAVNPWEPFFDPLDDALWARGSDVDWLKGTWVHAYTHPASLHERHPWSGPHGSSAYCAVHACASVRTCRR